DPPRDRNGSTHQTSSAITVNFRSLYVLFFGLCLSPGNEFSSGKSLPAIKPSPLQTLTALVQEIQSSGETGQELWKDSEVTRFFLLHL
uniref:Uncharacterized protein n=1 Tax=Paramormyrops kingsleyae TaxID=1676925 RepID=A0A3B3R8E3_9TELE